jgi:hypothetical protein
MLLSIEPHHHFHHLYLQVDSLSLTLLIISRSNGTTPLHSKVSARREFNVRAGRVHEVHLRVEWHRGDPSCAKVLQVHPPSRLSQYTQPALRRALASSSQKPLASPQESQERQTQGLIRGWRKRAQRGYVQLGIRSQMQACPSESATAPPASSSYQYQVTLGLL